MPKKGSTENQQNNVVPKKPSSKNVRKPKLQEASRNQIRNLVERRFMKQKRVNTKQNKMISPKKVRACLDSQHFNCSICLELMVKPTSLCCGHSFCLPCIEKLNKTEMKYKCSLCRQPDHKDFYEIDKAVEKLLLYIQLYKLKEKDAEEYNLRKEEIKKEFALRGITLRLNPNDEVKVKVKGFWERGRIVSVRQISNNRYYILQTALSNEAYCLPMDSVNIALTEDCIKRMKDSSSRGIFSFSENIFIEDYAPRPMISNTYNIEELLWEVNYYSPVENNFNGWNFSPQQVGHNELSQNDDSIQFLPRSMFGRNIGEPIEID